MRDGPSRQAAFAVQKVIFGGNDFQLLQEAYGRVIPETGNRENHKEGAQMKIKGTMIFRMVFELGDHEWTE